MKIKSAWVYVVSRCDLVMGAFGVMPRQVFAAFLGNYGSFVIRPREGANCIDGIPKYNCDELDLVCVRPSEQVASPVAFHLGNPGQEFRFQHGLIGFGVFGLGVSVPDSCDQNDLLGMSGEPILTGGRKRKRAV